MHKYMWRRYGYRDMHKDIGTEWKDLDDEEIK
jgi:hypothetical protein